MPWTIRVPDATALWVEAIRRDMRNAPAFSWVHQQAAAQFCLQNKVNLEEALGWARQAANPLVGGQENFSTMMTLAGLLEATGKASEGTALVERALNHPAASAIDLHQYGRQLLTQKRPAEALKVFETNARRFNGAWPTQVGLMRGYAAAGRTKDALEAARKALAQAPDDLNRRNIESLIARLESGQPLG